MAEYGVLKPDRDFVESIVASGGGDLTKCFQCATCSVVCELAPDRRPFPRKEMIWAQWGLKDRLIADPDVWLCYQCNDCSTRCPRGARPGDVLAAIRRESVIHYSVPGFLGRWVSQPKYFPLLLGIPTVLLGLMVLAPIEKGRGAANQGSIVYSCWHELPHWALISFFVFFSVLALLAVVAGAARFWRAMKAADERNGLAPPAKGLGPSIVSALKSVVTHDNFTKCTSQRSRYLSHMGVFYGFIALSVVALWVVTASCNPLIGREFVYPFSFWNPWRILANIGGIALIAGCLLMIWERRREGGSASTFFDWAFIGTLLIVVATGFLAELLHYARLEPHRLIAYFIHLVFVFALLMYLPYSKFAHLIYRTVAMVYAEYSGRNQPSPAAAAPSAAPATPATGSQEGDKEQEEEAEKSDE